MRGLVVLATAAALLMGVSPAVAVTAVPPNVVHVTTTWSSGYSSTSTESTTPTASITPAGAKPETFTVLDPYGNVSLRLRAAGAGQQLVEGATTATGSGGLPVAGRVEVPSLSCVSEWAMRLDVIEVVRTDGAITGFAADWAVSCTASTGSKPLTKQRTGSVRYGSSSGTIGYAVPSVGATWVAPAATPEGSSRTTEIPITVVGDPVAVTDVAVAPGFSTISGDSCTGQTVSSASPCTVTLTMAPPAGTNAASADLALDVTTADGRTVRLSRVVAVRPALTPPTLRPYPVAGGLGVMILDAGAPDLVSIRRRAPGGEWTDLGSVSAESVGGVRPHVIDTDAAPGVRYEYAGATVTIDAEFSSAYSTPVGGTRPFVDGTPTDRTRWARKLDVSPAPPALVDTAAGLTTRVATSGAGVTSVTLTDPLGHPSGRVDVGLIPGPGTYPPGHPGVYLSMSINSTNVYLTPGTLVVRDVLFAEDGGLQLLDASVRSATAGQVAAEIRFRADSGLAVPVATPASPTIVADPDGSAEPQPVVVTNTGPDAVTVGPVVLDDDAAGRLSTTPCAPTALAPGESCTASLALTGAATPGAVATQLRLAAFAGTTEIPVIVPVTARTSDVATAPRMAGALAYPARVLVSWVPPVDDGGRPVTGSVLERRPVGSTTWQRLTAVAATSTEAIDEAPTTGPVQYRAAVLTSRGVGAFSDPVTLEDYGSEVHVGTVEERDAGGPWGVHVEARGSGRLLPLRVDGHEHRDPGVTPDATAVVVARAGTAGAGHTDFDLWRIPFAAGAAPVRLTSLPGAERDPVVSPDGRRVAFTYDPPPGSADARPQLWTVQIDGSGVLQRGIGFTRPAWENPRSLVVADVRAAMPVLVRIPVAGSTTGAPVPIPGTSGGTLPTVSPSGATIAFLGAGGEVRRIQPSEDISTVVEPANPQYSVQRLSWLNERDLAVTLTDSVADERVVSWSVPYWITKAGAHIENVPVRDSSAPLIGSTRSFVRAGETLTFSVSDPSSPRAGVLVTCRIDSSTPRVCETPTGTTGLVVSGLAQGKHTLVITAKDVWGNTTTSTRTFTVDDIAPTAPSLSVPRWVRTTVIGATYRATDANPLTYQIRQRVWGIGSRSPGGWTTTSRTTTAASLPVAARSGLCLQVRAVDPAGNVGAWSAERCSTRPLDDRDLRRSGTAWKYEKGSSFYLATVSSAKRSGVRLSSKLFVGASQFVLLATRCSTCGSVAVYHGDVRIATVSLRSSTTRASAAITLPRTRYRYATLEIRTLSAAQVRIDGIVPLR